MDRRDQRHRCGKRRGHLWQVQQVRPWLPGREHRPGDAERVPQEAMLLRARVYEPARGRVQYPNPHAQRIGVRCQRIDQSAQVRPYTGIRHGQEIAINGDSDRFIVVGVIAVVHHDP